MLDPFDLIEFHVIVSDRPGAGSLGWLAGPDDPVRSQR